MHAATDHQLTGHGNDRMSILDEESKPIAVARRQDGVWNISAEGVDEGTAASRDEAILQLTKHALLATRGTLEGPGFSTFVPHTIRDLP